MIKMRVNLICELIIPALCKDYVSRSTNMQCTVRMSRRWAEDIIKFTKKLLLGTKIYYKLLQTIIAKLTLAILIFIFFNTTIKKYNCNWDISSN